MTDSNPPDKPINHHSHKPKQKAEDNKIATTTTKISAPGHKPIVVKNDIEVSTAAVQNIIEREAKVIATLAAVPFWGAIKALLILACLLTGFIIYESRDAIIAEIVKSIDRSTSLEHKNALHSYLEGHKLIGPAIKSLREDTKASRVVLYQFHNGTNSLKGVPFLFASQTEVITSAGVSDDHDTLQRIPIGMFIDWLPKFLDHECVQDDIDTANSSMKELMTDHGVHTAFACPIYVQGSHEPSGFLAVSYMYDPPTDNDALTIIKLKATASVIGATLAKVSVAEPK